MSYQVFARKYRPKTFADVLGQDHVIQTLRNAIEQDRLAHAYLFVGPRGTGKTSTARILAKALNCKDGPSIEFDPDEPLCQEIAEGRSLDVLEIDGASNNGVEQVRDLRDNVRFAPTSCRYKIYYIDEVHMLTTAAFNALLKTLEEPPEHVKFIFATTEPNKILPTIISRCQRFDLRPISTQTIADHLGYIAKNEGVDLAPSAAWTVAKGADGGMRDAQSMLDQLVAFCGNTITEENVIDVFGFTSRETVAKITQAILAKNTAETLSILNEQAEAGKELTQLLDDTIGCLRSLLVSKVDPNAENDGIPEILWKPLLEASKPVPTDRLLNLIDIFADTDARMKWASNKKLHFEIGIIKAIHSLNDARISDVIKALAGAGPVSVSSTDTNPPAPPTEPTQKAEPAPQPAPTPEPSQPEPTAGKAPEPEPEPNPEPTPPVEMPAPAPIEIEEAQAKHPQTHQSPPTSEKKDIFSNLDNFIESAPETAPAPEPAIIEKQKAAETQAAIAAQAPDEPEEEKTDHMEEFYNEPLITQALEKFKGTLIK